MLVLDNADKIRADTTTASKVDYVIHGVVGTTLTQLADGQLASSIGDLYTSTADATVIASMTFVNTNSSTEAVNLYLLPSGGTARRLIPQNMDLAADYMLMFDGNKMFVVDDTGQVMSRSI